MNDFLIISIDFSIVIAALTGYLRFRKISSAFFPFLCFVWFGSINEIINSIMELNGFNTLIVNNICLLIESLLITWQFKRWRLFYGRERFYYGLLATLVLGWLIENIFISKFVYFNFYFIIFYSFAIVLMSINKLNLLFAQADRLKKNATFIICAGFILFYTLMVSINAFGAYGLYFGPVLQQGINYTRLSVNLICNLIFALAILWMPKREPFSLQF